MERVFAIVLRQSFIFLRSPTRLFSFVYWSTFELFVWGIITRYFNQIGKADINFMTLLLGAVILWNLLTRIQQTLTIAFLEDVRSRNLVNIFASPISVLEYCLGLTAFGLIHTTISMTLMTVVARGLFAYNLFTFGVSLIPFIGLLFIFGWSVGIVATALILRFGPVAEMIVWSFPALLLPFSAVFHPVASLPLILQPIAHLFPSSYIFEGMRQIVMTGSTSHTGLMQATFLTVCFWLFAFCFFLDSYKRVLRLGLFRTTLT